MDIIGNRDYEEIIVGYALSAISEFDERSLRRVMERVQADDFAFIRTRNIMRTIAEMHSQKSEMNLITIANDTPDVDIMYLSSCLMKDGVNILIGNVDYYIDTIKELALKRQIANIAASVLGDINTDVTGAELLARLQTQKAPDDGRAKPIADLLPDFLNRTEARAKRQGFDGVPYFLPKMNLYTAGKEPGQFIVFGGRPGDGKSSMLLDDAVFVAVNQGKKVLFFTLEVTKEQVTRNAVSILSGVPVTDIKRGYLDAKQWAKIHDASAKLYDADLIIHDESGVSLATIERQIIALQPDVVYIDYLQLMTDRETAKFGRYQEMSHISKSIKDIAKRHRVPIVSGAQLNRESVGNSVPQNHHLRETGSIEQDADVIVLLHPDTSENASLVRTPTDVRISKNRDGEVGKIACTFNKPVLRYEEIAR